MFEVHTQVLKGIGASGVQPFMQGGVRQIHTHNQCAMHPPASWLIKCVCVCVYVPVWSRENSRNRSCTVRSLPVFLSFIPPKGFYMAFHPPSKGIIACLRASDVLKPCAQNIYGSGAYDY